MPALLALLVLPLLLPLLHALPLSVRSAACPVILPVTRQVTPRVIGGVETTSTAAPFAIALSGPLTEASTRRLCTGARLSRLWVVTAAHCGVDTTWTAQLPDGTSVAIAQVHTHEGYKEVTDRVYDIAVLLLSPPDVPDGAEIVRVNSSPALPKPGAFVRVTGFGASKDEAPSADVLRRVDVPVVPFAKCVDAYLFSDKTGKMDPAAQMCSGYLTAGGCDSCDGDSGGPVIQYNPAGDPVIVAVVSAGRGCALPQFPGINLRVDQQIAWMKKKGVEFETDDNAVQVVLDGGYPDTPPDEKAPKPSPSPSPSPSSAPPPASASPSAPPKPRPSPDRAPASDAPAPEKTRQPQSRPDRSPAAQSEDARPGSGQELPPAVMTPAPSPSADAARPTRTPSPAPSTLGSEEEEEEEEEEGGGAAASATPGASTAQEEEEGGEEDAAAEAAENGSGAGPGLDGGEADDDEFDGKAASTDGDARVAGIVGGVIAGVVLIGGVVVFIVKTR